MSDLNRRQSEIVNAALEIIATSGVQELTMKNVGRRLDMTDAALYRHFSGKQDILLAITDLFEVSSTRLLERITASPATGLTQVKMFFLDRCREFAANRGLALVMFSDELFRSDKKVSNRFFEIMSRHRDLLLNAVIQAQQNGEINRTPPPDHLFMIVMGALRLLVTRWRSSKFSFDLDAEGSRLWLSLEDLLKEKKNETTDH